MFVLRACLYSRGVLLAIAAVLLYRFEMPWWCYIAAAAVYLFEAQALRAAMSQTPAVDSGELVDLLRETNGLLQEIVVNTTAEAEVDDEPVWPGR